MSARFQKHERLSLKRDYDLAFQQGRPFRNRETTVFVRPNGLPYSRLGLTVGRKAGGSVRRTRIKRVFRELFRLHKDSLRVPCDLVIIPRQALQEVSCSALRDGFRRLLEKINQSCGSPSETRNTELG